MVLGSQFTFHISQQTPGFRLSTFDFPTFNMQTLQTLQTFHFPTLQTQLNKPQQYAFKITNY
ncbi:MAG: hypothetical protein CFE24_07350 [Flavobacterium sp. BFFFF2]|nr:MAG: hypothetical protein CFE24_07350 [Flavobacterium sp. BFFFF2]